MSQPAEENSRNERTEQSDQLLATEPENLTPKTKDETALHPIVSEESPTLEKWCSSCFRSPLLLVYISHGLSTWGDRMWAFTMGMLLVDWENLQSLRTVAIHQLCQAGAVFIFGALIGSWVDRSRRLRASVSSIVAQNSLVCISALVLLILLKTTEDRNKDEPALWQHHLAVGVAIAFSTLAYLASVACQLTVVKDWVPTLCNENKTKLTATNAILKRIDLTTAILSPLLAGAAMEAAGAWAGGVVVVCWNILSAPCEIALLYLVYRNNPRLHAPKVARTLSSASYASNGSSSLAVHSDGCCANVPLLRPAFILFRGWRTYWRQPVRWSGASLSALYFTVLSFDAVTTAYVRSLCVSELVVAGVRIGSFVLGLVGTVVFPHIRKRFGLRKGGSIFYISHAVTLGIAAIAVFLPGSPLSLINRGNVEATPSIVYALNETSAALNFSLSTTPPYNATFNNNVTENLTPNDCAPGDNVRGFRFPHLWVLMIAVIISRLTLWGTDLSINQALVERVAPSERGVVNGVQNSLNQMVDLIRLVIVICVPFPSQFGYLIIATFFGIVAGAVLYNLGSPPDEFEPNSNNDNSGQTEIFTRKA